MKELKDAKLLERYLAALPAGHIFSSPSQLPFQLVQFEKGEFLTRPDKPLTAFLFLVEGSVLVYGIREDGNVFTVNLEKGNALLGDMEFIRPGYSAFFSEAAETVTCLRLPFALSREKLEQDPVFLKYLLGCVAGKLESIAHAKLPGASLEERLLYDLRFLEEDHTIHGVGKETARLHCSRRQLQRVLVSLQEKGMLIKLKKGVYRLCETDDNTQPSH